MAAALATTVVVATQTLAAAGAAGAVTATAVAPRAATARAVAEVDLQRAVVRVTNRRRAAHGLPPLKARRCPRDFAVRHSTRMATRERFGHSNLKRLLDRCATRHGAENIARFGGRAPTARAVVRAWMRSPGHRANILDRSMTHVGVGVVRGGDRWYVTQSFLELP